MCTIAPWLQSPNEAELTLGGAGQPSIMPPRRSSKCVTGRFRLERTPSICSGIMHMTHSIWVMHDENQFESQEQEHRCLLELRPSWRARFVRSPLRCKVLFSLAAVSKRALNQALWSGSAKMPHRKEVFVLRYAPSSIGTLASKFCHTRRKHAGRH